MASWTGLWLKGCGDIVQDVRVRFDYEYTAPTSAYTYDSAPSRPESAGETRSDASSGLSLEVCPQGGLWPVLRQLFSHFYHTPGGPPCIHRKVRL